MNKIKSELFTTRFTGYLGYLHNPLLFAGRKQNAEDTFNLHKNKYQIRNDKDIH